jgi:hypothetical protein
MDRASLASTTQAIAALKERSVVVHAEGGNGMAFDLPRGS